MTELLHNLSLKRKFLILSLTFLISFILVLVVVFASQNILKKKADQLEAIDKFEVDLSELRMSLNALRGEILISLLADTQTMSTQIARNQANYDTNRQRVDLLKKNIRESQKKLGNTNLSNSIETLSLIVNSLTDFTDQNMALAAKADGSRQDTLYMSVRAKILTEYASMFESFKKSIAKSADIAMAMRDQTYTDYEHTVTTANALLLTFFIGTIIFVFTFSQYLGNMIARPILQTKDTLMKISEGELPPVDVKAGKDEIGNMLTSLKTLVYNLTNLRSFTTDVGKGNFDTEVKIFNNQGAIAESLLLMRDNLKQSALKEQRAAWVSQRVAEAGKIMRQKHESRAALYDTAIQFVVRSMTASQGSLFIIADDDAEKLNLVSCYAYERKKFLEKTIYFGSGLVGQACLERDMVYLTDVPHDYVKITSGLGTASPNNLVILPLIHNDIVQGVIEVASFSKLKPHELEFFKQFGDLMASEIANEKVNAQTRYLLEKSQQQAEELRSQEEEMRQNMEELQATQELMQRQMREVKDVQYS
ncbi:MAG TPA: GAF domain-containing protein [Ohtaekwangia sp.]|uniref:GAF domain-containing protein n=1 Tax=Ohtaekwangia sp. TaxID=2066019 RepID=UPI002F94B0B3